MPSTPWKPGDPVYATFFDQATNGTVIKGYGRVLRVDHGPPREPER